MKLTMIYQRLLPVLFILTQAAFAGSSNTIEFFASNNTGTIGMETAFQRLRGEEQHDLQNAIAALMQRYHLEQGTMDEVLGAYQLSGSGAMTADNTETFSTSPYEKLKNQEAFYLAQKMATALKQESVAVFIPSRHAGTADLQLQFKQPLPTISAAIQAIHEKLPAKYGQAYSLHLRHAAGDYASAEVAEIEWLGSHTDASVVSSAFPTENVVTREGKAYLVYQNGKRKQL